MTPNLALPGSYLPMTSRISSLRTCILVAILHFVSSASVHAHGSLAVVTLLALGSHLPRVSSQGGEHPHGRLFEREKYIHEVKSGDELAGVLTYLAEVSEAKESLASDAPFVQPTGQEEEATVFVNEVAHRFRLQDTDNAYLVLFYSSWCPHCRRTAPIWSAVGSLFHCTPGIRFFAYECSQPAAFEDSTPLLGNVSGPLAAFHNLDPLSVCLSQGVRGYPAATLYMPATLRGQKLPNTNGTQQSDESNYRREAVVKPSDLRKLESPTSKKASLRRKRQQQWFVLQSKGGVGQENKTIEADFRTVLVRTLIRIPQRSLMGYRDWILTNTPIHRIRKCVLGQSDSELLRVGKMRASNIVANSSSSAGTSRWPVDRPDRVCEPQARDTRLHDAMQGLLYLLRNWVVTELKVVEPDRLTVLRQLLQACALLLPGSNVRASLRDLQHELSTNSDSSGNSTSRALSVENYQQLVSAVNLGGLVAAEAGHDPQLLYTESLTGAVWLLFHTLSASLVARSEPSAMAEGKAAELSSAASAWNSSSARTQQGGEPKELSALELADTLRDTIDRFFGCSVCRVHFTTFFSLGYAGLWEWVGKRDVRSRRESDATIRSPPESPRGLLLWLWRFHNAVTFRTAVERTADELLDRPASTQNESRADWPSWINQDVRFPTVLLCPACRLCYHRELICSTNAATTVVKDDSLESLCDQVQASKASIHFCDDRQRNQTASLSLGLYGNPPSPTAGSPNQNGKPGGWRASRLEQWPYDEEPNAANSSYYTKFIVSPQILDEALAWEMSLRGLPSVQLEIPSPIADDTWDRVEDFHLEEVSQFLLKFYYDAAWLQSPQMRWNPSKMSFDLSLESS